MGTYLDSILEAHRRSSEADRRSVSELEAGATFGPPVRDFRAALATPGLSVIAEVKRRSPSAGALTAGLDPGVLAKSYEVGGAAAVSILTDVEFFGGSAADLAEARAAIDLPVLRKDFTVGAPDVYDARAIGADAVLLIVAALDDAELQLLHRLAIDLGMAALVECHDEGDVQRAMDVGAVLVGVNQRDLVTFEVDPERAVRVRGAIGQGAITVAESGIRGADDAARLADAGYDAILVGEHLVRSADPAMAVAALRVPPRPQL